MTTGNRHFDRLVAAGHPVGEVNSVDHFIVKVRGLQPVNLHALVMFEDGSKGFVHQIENGQVVVMHFGVKPLAEGMVAVVQHQELVCKVGKDLIGRVISVNGEPLDGKGPVAADAAWPVFNLAPAMFERQLLDTQLESGITAIDALFPIVRGQRLALLGDSKAGKTTIATQLTLNQKQTDQVVVYCLIAKRRSDIDMLLNRLQSSGAIETAVIVVSTVFESLVMSYLAPYVACSIAEYLWQVNNQDTIIVYDDLTSHAQVVREMALLAGVNPGRDSYPGDMFYAHSSLLERAGKLLSNGKTLTSLPVVLTPNDDITAYLSTSIMSITDGQIILDLGIFRRGIRPAVNAGLSVSRVGGQAQTGRQKRLSGTLFKTLAKYKQAEEFSHFGSSLSKDAQIDLTLGQQVYAALQQTPEQLHSLTEQQLVLETIMLGKGEVDIDVVGLKEEVKKVAKTAKKEEAYDAIEVTLLKKFTKTEPVAEKTSEATKDESHATS